MHHPRAPQWLRTAALIASRRCCWMMARQNKTLHSHTQVHTPTRDTVTLRQPNSSPQLTALGRSQKHQTAGRSMRARGTPQVHTQTQGLQGGSGHLQMHTHASKHTCTHKGLRIYCDVYLRLWFRCQVGMHTHRDAVTHNLLARLRLASRNHDAARASRVDHSIYCYYVKLMYKHAAQVLLLLAAGCWASGGCWRRRCCFYCGQNRYNHHHQNHRSQEEPPSMQRLGEARAQGTNCCCYCCRCRLLRQPQLRYAQSWRPARPGWRQPASPSVWSCSRSRSRGPLHTGAGRRRAGRTCT